MGPHRGSFVTVHPRGPPAVGPCSGSAPQVGAATLTCANMPARQRGTHGIVPQNHYWPRLSNSESRFMTPIPKRRLLAVPFRHRTCRALSPPREGAFTQAPLAGPASRFYPDRSTYSRIGPSQRSTRQQASRRRLNLLETMHRLRPRPAAYPSPLKKMPNCRRRRRRSSLLRASEYRFEPRKHLRRCQQALQILPSGSDSAVLAFEVHTASPPQIHIVQKFARAVGLAVAHVSRSTALRSATARSRRLRALV